MGHLKYVALSDLHLGSKDSLLTGLDSTRSNPVTKQFAQCLRTIMEDCSSEVEESKPALVLHGDVLDLAMSSTRDASLAFKQFIEELIPSGPMPFSRIIVIPGNHDHHLWESANANKYLSDISEGNPIGDYRHTTKIFCGHAPHHQGAFLLKSLVHKYCPGLLVNISYPTFGDRLKVKDKTQCVIFDYGHYGL